MAHEWEHHPESFTMKRPFQKWRRCKHCKAEQEYVSQHEWMRVVGYRWSPRAGRCTAKPPKKARA